MAQKIITAQQQIKHLATDYPGLLIKSGNVVVSCPAGEQDIGNIILDTKFPNNVLFSSCDFGFPSSHWSHLPRSQGQAINGASYLTVNIHVFNGGGAQDITLYWMAVGY